MRQIIDLTAKTFGRLKVIRLSRNRHPTKGVMWVCQCSCKDETVLRVSGASLKSGNTKSCGCLFKESVRRNGSKRYKHGASKSKYLEGNTQLDYSIWNGIKSRCYIKSHTHYDSYGGKGIEVHDLWKDDFLAFASYIRNLPNCPPEKILVSRLKGKRLKVSIDRINNSKNYEPGNIKWSTSKEQSLNTSRNLIVTYKGERLPLKEMCDKHTHLPYRVVYDRVRKLNWSIKEALEIDLMS